MASVQENRYYNDVRRIAEALERIAVSMEKLDKQAVDAYDWIVK